jgi:hypothetical protein
MIATAACLLVLLVAAGSGADAASSVTVAEYGVDCTFPIHYDNLQALDECASRHGFGDRSGFYQRFMQSCRDHYGPKKAASCDETEQDRLKMSLYQTSAMVVS